MRFASSVKSIKTVAVQNKDKKDAMIEKMEEEIKIAKEQQNLRDKVMKESGVSKADMAKGFGVSQGTPYFLNLSDDPALAGCLIFLIKEGEKTNIGADEDNTITLKGVGIPEKICYIEKTNIGADEDNTITLKG